MAPPPGRRSGAASAGHRARQRLDGVADLLGVVFLEPREQRPVERTARHELVVRALLDDASRVEHDDPIGEMQRRATMRDEQRRATRHDAAQRVVDGGLDTRVDGAGRVVEDEDARVIEDRPRERDALALAAGEA